MKYLSTQTVFDFVKDVYRNKFVIYQLTKRDYQNRYIGSILGFIWTIIQPLAMIFILWFVFAVAFKSGSIRNTPFVAWLTIGLVPWYFFSEALASGTNVFQEYSYLVKKIQFQTAILPIVKLLSSFITHAVFIVIGIIILLASGVDFSFWWFQMFYYLIGMALMLLGLSWILSSIQVFSKDVAQIINIVLTFGFWLTPIMWDYHIIPEKYSLLFKLNPMFYIVEGYRNSFIFHIPFWDSPKAVIGFWVLTFSLLAIGTILFKKLKPHFADVL